MISLSTAATLTEWSKRTLWRRISDGTLVKSGAEEILDDRKTRVDLEAIRDHICIPVTSEDLRLIENADAGDAEAQTDLAVLFFAHGKLQSALYWLDLSSRQDCPSGMYWLGRCYVDGTGVAADENIGVMWLAKAASLGHVLSRALMSAILGKAIR